MGTAEDSGKPLSVTPQKPKGQEVSANNTLQNPKQMQSLISNGDMQQLVAQPQQAVAVMGQQQGAQQVMVQVQNEQHQRRPSSSSLHSSNQNSPIPMPPSTHQQPQMSSMQASHPSAQNLQQLQMPVLGAQMFQHQPSQQMAMQTNQLFVPDQHMHQQFIGQPHQQFNTSPLTQDHSSVPQNPNQIMQQQQQQQPVLTNYQPQMMTAEQMAQNMQQQMYQQPMATMQGVPVMYQNAQTPSNQSIPSQTDSAPGSPSDVVKRGRFRVSKGAKSLKNLVEAAASDVNATSDTDATKNTVCGINKEHEHATPVPPPAAEGKKKGRFIVKTGGSPVGAPGGGKPPVPVPKAPEATNAKSPVAAESASKPKTEQTLEVKDTTKPTSKKEAADDNPTVEKLPRKNSFDSAASSVAGTAPKPTQADATSSTKKKGRFVVKTGGNATDGTVIASASGGGNVVCGHVQQHSDGSINPAISPTPSMLSTSYQPQQQMPTQQYVQPTQQLTGTIPMPMAMPAAPMPSVSSTQTLGLVDVNGQIMVVSAPILAAPTLNLQQTPQPLPQQSMSNGMQIGVQSQLHLPSQVPIPAEVNQQQQPQTQQPRVGKEALTSTTKKPAIPVKPSVGTRGAPNGRLLGAGGVGKVLHYLDSVRHEVVEAESRLTTLQTDNRFLVRELD